jgi:glycosyltransferase involved in cell wall biosynthesis
MQAKVSLLMPTYEPNPDFLHAAIASVLSQTEQAWTLFIHDDASTTNVRAMIEEYLHDPRITFERSAERLGIGGNWNACLRHASAAYVQYIFQDDEWSPQYLATAIDALTVNPSAGFVSVAHAYEADGTLPKSFRFIMNERKSLAAGLHKGNDMLRDLERNGFYPNILGEPSFVMMQKAALDRAGDFDATLTQSIDLEMWIRLLHIGDVVVAQESLGSFRVHPESASSTRGLSMERIRILWRHRYIGAISRFIVRWIRARIHRGTDI